MMQRPAKSRGAALLVALLIAALVAVIATKVGSQYILSFRRSSNMMLGDQGYLYLLSAEALAKNVLLADEDLQVDHLGEAWAQQVQPYIIDGGLLTGQIFDLQARFNLNNLRQRQPARDDSPVISDEQKMFIRLLRTFEDIDVTEQQAIDISSAVVDWLDENEEPIGFSGAEDEYYTDLEIPYRAANVAMLSVTELRLVKGMTAELYQALLPHITALPEETSVNSNTATVNVLRSLRGVAGNELEPESLEDIQPLLERREEQILFGVSPPAFGQDDTDPDSDSPGSLNSGQTSNYFLFDGMVKLGDLTLPVHSILNRKSADSGTPNTRDQVSVTRRSLGSL